jgi:hypothetical protein
MEWSRALRNLLWQQDPRERSFGVRLAIIVSLRKEIASFHYQKTITLVTFPFPHLLYSKSILMLIELKRNLRYKYVIYAIV